MLLSETFEPEQFSKANSFLLKDSQNKQSNGTNGHPPPVIEVGPRQQFTSAWSTNAVSICASCGIPKISRIERSRRYAVTGKPEYLAGFPALVHDRMTEK